VIGRGDVQWMTAGKGVMHSEMPGPDGVHSLQLWLNLPAGQKMTKARYCDQRAADAPVVQGDKYELRVYAGRQGGQAQPHGSSYPMGLFSVTAAPGARVELEVPADERAFLYVVKGGASIGGDEVRAGQSAWFDPSGETGTDKIVLVADSDLQAVLYCGRPIAEPVVAYGPFVMNTMEEIRQAFADYQRGEFI
jgi:redox-sensitive bicupin YhaK (pirin superfamily)